MKKIATLILLIFIGNLAFSQTEEKLKNFRFGLKGTPSLNWYKPDDQKKFESGGLRAKFGYGLITEFRLTSVASLTTGLQVDYDGGVLTFKDTVGYFISQDEIINKNDTAGKKYDSFLLQERNYNTQYVSLPLMIKMKTKEIGYLTYFGTFGFTSSFRTKARVNDDGKYFGTTTNTTIKDLDVTKELSLIKLALNIGFGAEYNISGSTSLLFGLTYGNGFTNVLKKDSEHLLDETASALKQKAYANNITLTVGILF